MSKKRIELAEGTFEALVDGKPYTSEGFEPLRELLFRYSLASSKPAVDDQS